MSISKCFVIHGEKDQVNMRIKPNLTSVGFRGSRGVFGLLEFSIFLFNEARFSVLTNIEASIFGGKGILYFTVITSKKAYLILSLLLYQFTNEVKSQSLSYRTSCFCLNISI